MIDHIGFPVSDYERAKAFYLRALAPLGYGLVMEVTQEQTGHDPAAGFGANGKPDFWIGGEGGLNKPMHVAILAKDRAIVDAFYDAAMAAGGRDNGAPGIRAHYHSNYYGAPSCSIPTVTTLRPCATHLNDSSRLLGPEHRRIGAVIASRVYAALDSRLTRFLHANRYPPRIKSGAGFRSKRYEAKGAITWRTTTPPVTSIASGS
jgi:catechol 2,3-dioxygenase-like lactoylglutathione lyase family enzyme